MMLRTMIVCALLLLTVPSSADDSPTTVESETRRAPNIIYILADDLGYAELGCYGQKIIQTPNIDRLAAEGMRFTQHYSGSPVCAPSRCILLTGKHSGHAYIRANSENGGWEQDSPEGQFPIPDETFTMAEMLKDQGYATAAFGKWGLGGPDGEGHPNRQGFDFWYGYLCQRVAHNYYPTHLWRNGEKDMLEGNEEWFHSHQRLQEAPDDPSAFDAYSRKTYAPDRMIEEALAWVRNHKDEPFFVYYATPVPHAAIQVPEDSLEPYMHLDEAPYLGQKGYLPHPRPRAGYAGMVTRMDDHIGELIDLVDDLGLTGDTIVMFSSDNGPTFNGGTDSTFFESAAHFRGLKTQVWEGGIRVPFIVKWPGVVQPGTTSSHISAFWDVMPTIAEIVDGDAGDVDGISMVPELRGDVMAQPRHDYLYWEYRGHLALRMGRWKAVWLKNQDAMKLFDLDADPGETTDLAARHPELVAGIEAIMRATHVTPEMKNFALPRFESNADE